MHFAYILETLAQRFLRHLLAKHFDGPKMFVAAAEESQNDLSDGRGDAYCGMLNASYNLKLRNVRCLHSGVSCWNSTGVRRHDA